MNSSLYYYEFMIYNGLRHKQRHEPYNDNNNFFFYSNKNHVYTKVLRVKV